MLDRIYDLIYTKSRMWNWNADFFLGLGSWISLHPVWALTSRSEAAGFNSTSAAEASTSLSVALQGNKLVPFQTYLNNNNAAQKRILYCQFCQYTGVSLSGQGSGPITSTFYRISYWAEMISYYKVSLSGRFWPNKRPEHGPITSTTR